MRLPDPPLLVITDRQQARRPLLEIIEAVLDAGCRWVSVREKDLPLGEQIGLAATLRPAAAQVGARLVLHGAVPFSDAAAAIVDGVHLPDAADAAVARAWRKHGKFVGRSIHAAGQASAANPAEIDYLIAGAVFASASKPGYGPSLGVEGFAAFARSTPVPVIGIGGVGAPHLAALAKAGAAGVAVMGNVMRASDPGGVVRVLVDAWRQAHA